MASDYRFPFMIRLTDRDAHAMVPIPGVEPSEARQIVRFALAVARSTMTYAWWHRIWKRPVWTLRDQATPIIAETVVFRPVTGALMLPHPDMVRNSIYAARPSAKEKDHQLRIAEANAKQDARIARDKFFDDIRPAAIDQARSSLSKRVSVMTRV